jgi:hypothetical protein
MGVFLWFGLKCLVFWGFLAIASLFIAAKKLDF